VGRGHARDGIGCQDAFSVHRSSTNLGDVVAVCVCDGAGSAKHAEVGAKLVSNSLATSLACRFEAAVNEPAETLFAAFLEAREQLLQCARQDGCCLGDYACTVVAVAACTDGRWVSWHVGDGGLVANRSESPIVLSMPTKGEFANVTHFITDSDVYAKVDCNTSTLYPTLSPIGFALFTDGVENSLVDRRSGQVATALRVMFGWHEMGDDDQVSTAIHENLVNVFSGLTRDDCSLVLMSRTAPAVKGEYLPKNPNTVTGTTPYSGNALSSEAKARTKRSARPNNRAKGKRLKRKR
jgi:hypothetical protein